MAYKFNSPQFTRNNITDLKQLSYFDTPVLSVLRHHKRRGLNVFDGRMLSFHIPKGLETLQKLNHRQ
jgi:hypothetical protein